MAEVTIQNVKKAYGSTQVIHGIDVQITDGAFVVLVGPSGCGKSTLLRIIAGLEDVTEGAILIGGQEVNDMAPKDRDIAMVFQNYGLYPHMTVAQNMGFALKLSKVPKEEIAKRVARAADILNLDVLLDRYPRQLSGGQRQRVAMGRAIVRNPQVFLFDEPLSNLDAKLRVQMRAEIKQLHARLKVTTVYVTHDQIEAMTMADLIVVMHDGVVKQAGAPLELYDTPANLFVAGFIGSPSMNFFEATATGGMLHLTDGQVMAPPPGVALTEGQAVLLGIRPEDLTIAETGLTATIDVVEPTGAEIHVNATLGGQPMTAVFRERHHLVPGQTISMAAREGRLHLFDPRTEMRLN
ncbi:MAG: ABC transporter ATP-binding protein [Paracoccus hibiscisoli]|uniref:ABC transporter ATP-binding protein n=1 Tax=Paracoccus hibiscisoli TaxID=2023261 RepID=UPI003918E25E